MFVLRSTYKALRARQEETFDRLTDTRRERDAFRESARTAARQFAEADAANTRLNGRNRRLKQLLDHHRDHGSLGMLRQQHDRRERLVRAAGRYLAALWAAQAEARKLARQAEIDQGVKADLSRRLGLAEVRAQKAEQPVWAEGAPPRPSSPSEELLQARAHARALEERLAELTVANRRCTCQQSGAVSS
jgi:hypothetical protein